MTIALPRSKNGALSDSVDIASVTAIGDESKPSPPPVSGSPMPVSSIGDEPWARVVFHDERQGEIPSSPAAEPPAPEPRVAAATAAGFVGAFGGDDVKTLWQEAGGKFGAGSCPPCCGPGATSSAVSIASSHSGSSSTGGGSTGAVEAGTGSVAAAAAAAEPPPVARQVTSPGAPANRVKEEHVQRERSAPLRPAQGKAVAAAGSGAGAAGAAAGRGEGEMSGLELLVASQLDGTDDAGLLDAFDELLEEDVLNGFGEEGDTDTDAMMLPFLEGKP